MRRKGLVPCRRCGGAGDRLDIDANSLKRTIYKLCYACDGTGWSPKTDLDREAEGQMTFLSEVAAPE